MVLVREIFCGIADFKIPHWPTNIPNMQYIVASEKIEIIFTYTWYVGIWCHHKMQVQIGVVAKENQTIIQQTSFQLLEDVISLNSQAISWCATVDYWNTSYPFTNIRYCLTVETKLALWASQEFLSFNPRPICILLLHWCGCPNQ